MNVDSTTPPVAPPPVRPAQFLVATLGFIVCILAIPVVIVLDGSMWGWALGTALWAANWGVQVAVMRMAHSAESPVFAVGLSGITTMARAFAVFLVLMLVGTQVSETAALTAGAVFLAAFSVDLMARTITFQVGKGAPRAGVGG